MDNSDNDTQKSDQRHSGLSSQLQRAYKEKHTLIAEIQSLKSALRKQQHDKGSIDLPLHLLLNENVRAATMTCMWVFRCQIVKAEARAFHRWVRFAMGKGMTVVEKPRYKEPVVGMGVTVAEKPRYREPDRSVVPDPVGTKREAILSAAYDIITHSSNQLTDRSYHSAPPIQTDYLVKDRVHYTSYSREGDIDAQRDSEHRAAMAKAAADVLLRASRSPIRSPSHGIRTGLKPPTAIDEHRGNNTVNQENGGTSERGRKRVYTRRASSLMEPTQSSRNKISPTRVEPTIRRQAASHSPLRSRTGTYHKDLTKSGVRTHSAPKHSQRTDFANRSIEKQSRNASYLSEPSHRRNGRVVHQSLDTGSASREHGAADDRQRDIRKERTKSSIGEPLQSTPNGYVRLWDKHVAAVNESRVQGYSHRHNRETVVGTSLRARRKSADEGSLEDDNAPSEITLEDALLSPRRRSDHSDRISDARAVEEDIYHRRRIREQQAAMKRNRNYPSVIGPSDDRGHETSGLNRSSHSGRNTTRRSSSQERRQLNGSSSPKKGYDRFASYEKQVKKPAMTKAQARLIYGDLSNSGYSDKPWNARLRRS
eukprot:CAMPEP_0185031100 /NCGR_PEP_ID=MMETSP1103-20130426/18388_1 /TAXON_ID=36769 /ORGANISM="Paraphysomonas bandaiensis, Strain Caron Lab Isolate" /LENGTH=593 /DNA_ID=CAMNT_0027566495 /DNA_START=72 /DNA_END=1853 /DNA_ORIENTATION=-